MRDFFDNILSFIYATSLTDDEFATTTSINPILDQGTYDDLARVLESRDSVTSFKDKLVAYYKAGGFNVAPLNVAKSNIFIGSPL